MSNHEGLSSRHEDNPQEVYDSHKNEAEQLKELQRKRVNAIYSSVLTLISFQERRTPDAKEPLITPYYEKALRTQKQVEQAARKEALTTGEPMKKIEKIPGENPKDRKNYAYLERLDLAIERGGNRLEKRIWQESIKNFAPIIEKENINNKSWTQLKKAFDDDRNGQGLPSVEYTESEMNKDYERLRQNQIDSINSWTEYLSNKETPFPTWFKIYAFDGVIKMGTYNHKYGKYENRDKSTIAPYPKVNPAALALTLDAVNNFFGQDKEKWFTEHTDDDQLNAIVKSGNFGKIYTHFFKEIYKPIPTPERTEDIEGEWFDFYPGQEDELAEASQGTPWCIASKQAGENYLKTNDHTIKDNRARFKLFKLKNESSVDGMSKTACASIRFDTQGRVAEVSGLANNSNQTIEDSLVPVVEQEVFKHPLDPDQHFKEKFRDKKELIRLQDKAKKGEELTLDEYAFLYEKNHGIFTLDTYGGPDLKITELRNTYNLSRLFQNEDADIVDKDLLKKKIECIFRQTNITDISQNLDNLLNYGISIDPIFNVLDSRGISSNLDTLLSHGIGIDSIFNKMDSRGISSNLDTLLSHGIGIDSIFNKMDSYSISNNIDTLLSHGIGIDSIFNKIDHSDISQNLDTLLNHGVSIDSIFGRMDSSGISDNLDTLLSHGISIDLIFSRITAVHALQNIDTLVSNGISVNSIFDKANSIDISNNLDTLLNHGINIDPIFSRMDSSGVLNNLNTLLNHGVSIDSIFNKMDSYSISNNLDTLLNHGISIDSIFNKMDNSDISQNLDNLLNHGISIDSIFNRMSSYDISYNLDLLREHGIPLSSIISKMSIFGLEDHIKTLERNPDNIRSIQKAIYRNIPIESIEQYILENIDIDDFCTKLLDENLDSILGNGSLELTMKAIVEEDLPDTFNKFLDEHPIDYSSMESEIYSHFASEIIESFEDTDYSAKLNDDRIVKLLIGSDLIDNLDALLQVMPIDRIVANMRPADIETYHDELVAHGATL